MRHSRSAPSSTFFHSAQCHICTVSQQSLRIFDIVVSMQLTHLKQPNQLTQLNAIHATFRNVPTSPAVLVSPWKWHHINSQLAHVSVQLAREPEKCAWTRLWLALLNFASSFVFFLLMLRTWDRWWPLTWWGRRGGWGRQRWATWCRGRWSRCRPAPRCRCRRSWWSPPQGGGWLTLRCMAPPFHLIPLHFISSSLSKLSSSSTSSS